MCNGSTFVSKQTNEREKWGNQRTKTKYESYLVPRVDTSHNGDKLERRQQKRRHAKTATTKTATTVVKTATVHKSKRRQLLVKTATVIGQNGDSHWSKRRSLVKTATTNGQNGDINKSITQTCDTISVDTSHNGDKSERRQQKRLLSPF